MYRSKFFKILDRELDKTDFIRCDICKRDKTCDPETRLPNVGFCIHFAGRPDWRKKLKRMQRAIRHYQRVYTITTKTMQVNNFDKEIIIYA
jgi:hypothetical protein